MSAANRTPVTVLGLGPMGQALARAFLAADHPTTVWNRTLSKADRLVADGAVLAPTAADAALAGELVVICVIDAAAVRSVVEQAADALRGRTLVNLTADTAERARELARWAGEHSIDYLPGAIMTPTSTIGNEAASILYSGPEPLFQKHRSTLAALDASATYLGADPGRAAAHEVALLDLFWSSVSGLLHAYALARAENITAGELAPFAKGIGDLIPIMIDEFASHIDSGEYPGAESNTISTLAGIDHVIEASEARGIDTTALTAIRATVQRVIDSGHGEDSIARLSDALRVPVVAG